MKFTYSYIVQWLQKANHEKKKSIALYIHTGYMNNLGSMCYPWGNHFMTWNIYYGGTYVPWQSNYGRSNLYESRGNLVSDCCFMPI